ncbi:MAG: hypothetical protein EAX96_20270 [Candidatus Lokiarchaeota archaeon]|nr:hypothetical protein [Candidatus Lokiarchaeota archaeon]
MEKDLEKYRECGKKIEQFIRPLTFPIAVKLIKDESEIPPKTRRPPTKNFICQNFKMTRSYGWTIAVLKEDCVCKFARGVYRWDEPSDEMLKFAEQFEVGLYSNDVETARKIRNHQYILKEDYIGLVLSPLTRTKIIPDVVLTYCLPGQAMRLTQSYLYFEGGILEFTDAGRIGSCHIGVIKTIQTEKPQLVILGNGDRVWGGAQDSEVMYAIPRSKLESIVIGLEATHKAGLRYPIPQYMNYEPGFQSAFQSRAKKRAGGTILKED